MCRRHIPFFFCRGERSEPRTNHVNDPQAPGKRYCFTINNPTADEFLYVIEFLNDRAHFGVCGEEVGECGTRHLQGFVNLKQKARFENVKEALGGRAHLERARGTDLENDEYCSKESVFWRVGEPSSQGKRSDLQDACDLLSGGGRMSDVARKFACTFVRYGRGLRDYVSTLELEKPRDWKTDVHVIIGPPGVGKSRWVFEKCRELESTNGWRVFYKMRGKWWDGYHGHEVIVMDDFYGWYPYDCLLRLFDRYPLRVETKGGTMQFLAKKIYVTSNNPPCLWYSEDEKMDPRALYRRLTTLETMRDGGELFIELPLKHPINC